MIKKNLLVNKNSNNKIVLTLNYMLKNMFNKSFKMGGLNGCKKEGCK